MAADPRLPLHQLLLAGAAPGTRPVTPDADRDFFLARVAAWRAAFVAVPGEHQALHHEDGLEFAAALFGGWAAGKTLWLPGDRLEATLANLDSQVQGRAGELPGGLATPAAHAGADLPALDGEACGLVLFTSGSTGEPGAIRKTLGQLDREVAALEEVFGAAAGDALVQGTVSHQHIYGLLFRLLWPLSAGRPFARRRLAYNEELTALGPDPLLLVASPAHLKRLPETQDWRPLSQALRLVFSSGGPLPADAAHDVTRLWGQAPVEVFGSTETGGIAWRRGDGLRQAWTPLPGLEWCLRDQRLVIRSPHLEGETWVETQDLAAADPEGGFVLRGRADRILKIEERRISLTAIERRLLQSPLLDEVRVVALPGHRILLAVAAVPSAEGRARLAGLGRAGLANELRAWLSGHAEAIALPRRWRFLDALPSDARGKTSERALAELFRPRLPGLEWLVREPGRARLAFDVSPDLAAFEGHFPQAAILPGVALIDWAQRLGTEAFGELGRFQRMEAVKFQHLVRPGMRVELDLDWTPGQLAFRFHSQRGVFSSGRLRFTAEAGE